MFKIDAIFPVQDPQEPVFELKHSAIKMLDKPRRKWPTLAAALTGRCHVTAG